MARKRTTRESPHEKSKDGGVLETLSASEAASILKRLLARHPELRSEAEMLAGDVLTDVSFLAVAEDVEAAVLQFDYDDLKPAPGAIPGVMSNRLKPRGSYSKKQSDLSSTT